MFGVLRYDSLSLIHKFYYITFWFISIFYSSFILIWFCAFSVNLEYSKIYIYGTKIAVKELIKNYVSRCIYIFIQNPFMIIDHLHLLNLQKFRVVVKPMQKPRLVLKFVQMEKNIGLALNEVIPSQGIIPLRDSNKQKNQIEKSKEI